MTKKIEILESGKTVRLDTKKDTFLGSLSIEDSSVTYYMHKTKNGRVFYADEWSAWDIERDFNGIAIADESEIKYYLRRYYPDMCDCDIKAILKVWPNFFDEVD